MIEEVPLQAIPAQRMLCVLNAQNFYIQLRQKLGRMYMSLLLNDNEIFSGMICRDRLPMNQSRLYSYTGDFVFRDSEGTSDPVYAGLGTRYKLLYLLDETLPDTFQTPIIDQVPPYRRGENVSA